MAIRSRGLVGLLCFALVAAAASAAQFKVGGQRGWSVPAAGDEPYNAWAGRMRFQIGDQLLFVYPKEADSVLLVEPAAYDACNATAYLRRFDDGSTAFTLDRSGPFFFISGNEASCRANQKLIVVVLTDRHSTPAPPMTPPSMPPPSAAPMPSPPSPSPMPTPSGAPPMPSPPSSSPMTPPSGAPMPAPAATPESAPPSAAPMPSPPSPSPMPTPSGAPPMPSPPSSSPMTPPSGAPMPAPAASPESAPPSPTTPAPGPAPTAPSDSPPSPGALAPSPSSSPGTPGGVPQPPSASTTPPPQGGDGANSTTPGSGAAMASACLVSSLVAYIAYAMLAL